MYYKIIDNVLTTEECDKIISYGLTLPLAEVTTYSPVDGTDIMDYSFNKRKGVNFVWDELDGISKRILNIINSELIYKNITYNKMESYLFNEYKENDFLNYHPDNFEIERGATITVIVQLNDNYDGGDFCCMIDNNEITFPKKKGSIMIFESAILHKVSHVKSGVRYSLNNWPKFIKQNKSIL